ncbi:uncharacterized protein LY79DRAFT_568690 [Colletotrichum navitas]|uniref:Uncharacterized protein n=1 Tax=Colletotrichum navitas TaxID=681940 RepID=A0AAD8PND0_9PEZI|nr:uncharacterized protein LY79DRAFT_568690 [Colletotrichum navitas]KAK1573370.1 hypothetical protein LY79DRAFT_568690 [Colletotrichum navitas]
MMQTRSRQTGLGLAAKQDRQAISLIARFPLSFHVSFIHLVQYTHQPPLEGFLLHHVRLMGRPLAFFILFFLIYIAWART